METARQEQIRRNVRPLSTICTQANAREREKVARTGGTWASKFGKKIISWDTAPKQEYFKELFRISRNQIIWGGQLFQITADKMLFDLEKNQRAGKVFNGNV